MKKMDGRMKILIVLLFSVDIISGHLSSLLYGIHGGMYPGKFTLNSYYPDMGEWTKT